MLHLAQANTHAEVRPAPSSTICAGSPYLLFDLIRRIFLIRHVPIEPVLGWSFCGGHPRPCCRETWCSIHPCGAPSSRVPSPAHCIAQARRVVQTYRDSSRYRRVRYAASLYRLFFPCCERTCWCRISITLSVRLLPPSPAASRPQRSVDHYTRIQKRRSEFRSRGRC